MHGCHGCRELMLDHLYDLLEADELAAFSTHLAGCTACQAELEKARAQQRLLAAAARSPFPGVQFAPPEAVAAAPAVLPLPAPTAARARRGRSWQRWAVAAAVLLALAGLGVPAYQAYGEYSAAEGVRRQHDLAVAEARARLDESERLLAEAAVGRDAQIEEVRHAVKARQLRLVVSGPRTVQPGAPADFQVLAYDLNGRPARADIHALLADGAPGVAAPVAAAPLARSADKQGASGQNALRVSAVADGVYRVSVPPALRLAPGRPAQLVVAARRPGDADEETEQVSLRGTVQPAAPAYLTHLTTDKPMYQPGEVVRFRSLTLDRLTLAPAQTNFVFHYTLTTPLGAVRTVHRGRNGLVQLAANGQAAEVKGPDGKPVRGVGAGEVLIEPGAPGGEYTLTVSEEGGRFAPARRKFLVNEYQKPRLDKKLDFNRPSYGPGDEVQARVTARRADGGPVADRPVAVGVVVDDRPLPPAAVPSPGRTDPEGQVLVRFKLPAAIERGQASLAVTFNDGGAVETIVRPIPVVLKKLDVEFFPEGGDLVAGRLNHVYVQVRTPLGKPAQLRGVLMDGTTALPVSVETLHDDREPGVNQGLGAFSFTPQAGHAYSLRIDSPAGVADRKPLPKVHEAGVVMHVPGGVFGPDEPLRVRVESTAPRTLLVSASCRGRLLDTVRLEKGQTEAVLRPTAGAGGVCRVTVLEELPTGTDQRLLRPVAERLVYRRPRQGLHVAVEADRPRYTPGEKVRLSLTATDEKQQPKPALVMLAVVDRSVLTLADEKTARAMPTDFLLTSEVRNAEDLEYADFLVGTHPRAARVLDLLLGTQGWRRFAEQAPHARPRAAEAEQLLVMAGQSAPRQAGAAQKKIDGVIADFRAKADTLVAEHRRAARVLDRSALDPAYREALSTLGRYRTRLQTALDLAVPVMAGLAGAFLLAGLWSLRRSRPAWGWAGVGLAGACVMLALAAHETFVPAPAGPAEAGRAVARLAVPAPADNGPLAVEDKPALAKGLVVEKAAGEALPGGVGGGGAGGPVPTAMPAAPGAATGATTAGGPLPGMAGAQQAEQLAQLRAGAERFNLAKADRAAAGRRLARAPEAKGKGMPGRGAGAAGGFGRMRQPGAAAGKPGRPGAGPRFDLARKREQFRDGKDLMQYLPFAPPMVVREYAHQRPANQTPALRSDFAETVFWHPVLVLPGGKAAVSFDLCDSVTTFQVTAFAHTPDGRLGAATQVIESRLPFTLAPRVPVEATSTDRIDVPVGVANNTPLKRSVKLTLKDLQGLTLVDGPAEQTFAVPGDERARRVFSLRPAVTSGTARLTVEGATAPFAADAVRASIRIVPDGFPVSGSSGDLLEASATHKIRLPAWMPGTLACKVDVYPSTLADLQKGLEGLLREPNGCFEQSSTSNYPNVLILDYLRTADRPNPALERRIREVLARGYQRLTSFECQDPGDRLRKGYEWFGGTAPPHEALTAYGLLQFRDMARVYDVDKPMLQRTQAYLMRQRDGKGGFNRNPRAIDTFGRAPQHVTDAYIVWALTESGKDDVAKELDALAGQAKKSDDPYFVSLVALSLANRDRKGEAVELLRTVAKAQKEDGRLEAKQTSITGSGGRDLQIETTALAVLGWLKADPQAFDRQVRSAVRWVGQQRGGYGGFGSTQSTILALKALIAHARANKRTPEGGVLRLFVGEKQVAELPFPAGVDHTLSLAVPEPEKLLAAGANTLRVEITGKKNVFPHTLSWSCRTVRPESVAGCPVSLTTSLAKNELAEGEAVRLRVKVKNVSGAGQGMAVAVVGLPAGLGVPEDLKQLKEHCRLVEGKRPTLAAFEIIGREVVLYWRDLAKDEVVEVPIDLIARVPGVYRGPASRAYLYYNADKKAWVDPLAVTIAAK